MMRIENHLLEINIDKRIDISLLGCVYPFNVFSAKEKKVFKYN